MAIDTFLQKIPVEGRGGEALDSSDVLAGLWPAGDASFPLLQYVDPYGDAVFNGAQMPEVIRELEVLRSRATSEEQKELLAEIIALAMRCRQQPETFLRFLGD